jgi:uncharacterized protein (TIGR03083 family)
MYIRETAVMELIAQERRALADALDQLTPDQWQGTTMCAGWTPGHVLAHLTMPFRISEQAFMAGLQECGGDFTRFSDGIADRDSKLPQAELVSVLRDNADTPWSPPGGRLVDALSHDVIHGLDIAWPLSIDYPLADRALTAVLDSITSPGTETYFGVPLDGIELTATDLDWTRGSGAPLAGRGRDLIMLLANRRVPRTLFEGAGLELAAASR